MLLWSPGIRSCVAGHSFRCIFCVLIEFFFLSFFFRCHILKFSFHSGSLCMCRRHILPCIFRHQRTKLERTPNSYGSWSQYRQSKVSKTPFRAMAFIILGCSSGVRSRKRWHYFVINRRIKFNASITNVIFTINDAFCLWFRHCTNAERQMWGPERKQQMDKQCIRYGKQEQIITKEMRLSPMKNASIKCTMNTNCIESVTQTETNE